MKKISLVVATLILSSSSFAAKLSESANALSSAWRSYHSLHAQHSNKEIDMVYGGADVSSRSIVNQATAAG